MNRIKVITAALVSVLLITSAIAAAAAAKKKVKMEKGLYAVVETTQGTVTCRLFEDKTPKTVSNFTGLAEGTRKWTDPKTGQPVEKRLYDGLIFHRVIPNFMIQGGDPLGNGMGGPGYRFEDEIAAGLSFDAPGKLAMANAGPNTNGSQFFITVAPTQWLTGKHTIFGEVTEGMDIVKKISELSRDNRDKPLTDVIIKKVTIKKVK